MIEFLNTELWEYGMRIIHIPLITITIILIIFSIKGGKDNEK